MFIHQEKSKKTAAKQKMTMEAVESMMRARKLAEQASKASFDGEAWCPFNRNGDDQPCGATGVELFPTAYSLLSNIHVCAECLPLAVARAQEEAQYDAKDVEASLKKAYESSRQPFVEFLTTPAYNLVEKNKALDADEHQKWGELAAKLVAKVPDADVASGFINDDVWNDPDFKIIRDRADGDTDALELMGEFNRQLHERQMQEEKKKNVGG